MIIIICLRESEVSIKRISVCIVTENLVEHGSHCLPCSYTNDIIDVTIATMELTNVMLSTLAE